MDLYSTLNTQNKVFILPEAGCPVFALKVLYLAMIIQSTDMGTVYTNVCFRVRAVIPVKAARKRNPTATTKHN